MRGALLFVASGLTLMGCQASVEDASKSQSEAPPRPTVQATLPIVSSPTIGLYRGRASVKVGDPWDKAREVFPQPSRGAYELRELPKRFPDSFEAHGWETGRGEGFGTITYDGKVVVAMYQLERSSAFALDEMLGEERRGVGRGPDTTISCAKGTFYFWHDQAAQSLMISAFTTGARPILTVAMGQNGALDALGISESAAHRTAERLNNPGNR